MLPSRRIRIVQVNRIGPSHDFERRDLKTAMRLPRGGREALQFETQVVIPALYGKATLTATLTVYEVAAASVTRSPNVVVDGRVTASLNVVVLNAPAIHRR